MGQSKQATNTARAAFRPRWVVLASGAAQTLRVLLALGLVLAGAGCSDSTTGNSNATTCAAGQAPRYDSRTGNFLGCVSSTDSGGLTDATDTDGAAGATDATEAGDSTTATDATAGGSDAAEAGSDTASSCAPGLSALEAWWQCPPERTSGNGLHGQACTSDADCWYGHCLFGSPFAGYDQGVGICTKNCGFPGPGSGVTECSKDDGNALVFKCTFEKTAQSGNDKIPANQPNVFKACLRECQSDADCAIWNPALPTCVANSDKYLSVGATKVCAKLVGP